MTTPQLAKMIDHTLLRADATQSEMAKLTEEAKQYQFASVCVNPGWVAYAAEQLQGTGVDICTVIGFPLGASTSETKAFSKRKMRLLKVQLKSIRSSTSVL